MKKLNISVKDSGSYVQCYQRIGERPLADVVFFNGDRNLQEVKNMRDALSEAVTRMEEWESNEAGIGSGPTKKTA